MAVVLTDAELVKFRAALEAETDPAIVQARLDGANNTIADFYNDLESPEFTGWKTNVSLGEVGTNLNGVELEGLTTADSNRVQLMFIISPDGIDPSLQDRRDFFDGIFSAAGGVITRAQLLILWKRLATRIEVVLILSGPGTDADPALFDFEGAISVDDVVAAEAL